MRPASLDVTDCGSRICATSIHSRRKKGVIFNNTKFAVGDESDDEDDSDEDEEDDEDEEVGEDEEFGDEEDGDDNDEVESSFVGLPQPLLDCLYAGR